MKKLILCFILALMNLCASAQSWKPKSGVANFNVKMLFSRVEGKLTGMAANLEFDGAQPSQIYASVKASTVDTDNNLRDTHLREKEDFFQADKFPILEMNSTKIQSKGKAYEGDFDLTIKGVTRSVHIPFVFETKGNQGQFRSNFTINRQDWDFGGNTPGMGDEVRVTVVLNVVKE